MIIVKMTTTNFLVSNRQLEEGKRRDVGLTALKCAATKR
jgi:hypothetical protein